MVPIEYAEGVQLLKQPQIPCTVDNKNNKMCNLYKYIDLNRDGFVLREAEEPRRRRRNVVRLFNDTDVTSKLEFNAMVLVSPQNVGYLNTPMYLCRAPIFKRVALDIFYLM